MTLEQLRPYLRDHSTPGAILALLFELGGVWTARELVAALERPERSVFKALESLTAHSKNRTAKLKRLPHPVTRVPAYQYLGRTRGELLGEPTATLSSDHKQPPKAAPTSPKAKVKFDPRPLFDLYNAHLGGKMPRCFGEDAEGKRQQKLAAIVAEYGPERATELIVRATQHMA